MKLLALTVVPSLRPYQAAIPFFLADKAGISKSLND
jgi:hypothetical protein